MCIPAWSQTAHRGPQNRKLCWSLVAFIPSKKRFLPIKMYFLTFLIRISCGHDNPSHVLRGEQPAADPCCTELYMAARREKLREIYERKAGGERCSWKGGKGGRREGEEGGGGGYPIKFRLSEPAFRYQPRNQSSTRREG